MFVQNSFVTRIDNAIFYLFIFLVKIWSENSISISKHPKLSTFEYGCLVGLHIKEGKKQRRGGALMNNLISHRWYDMEKLTVPGRNKFFRGTEKKFFVKKMKEKCVTFCFTKLNANRFLQNHRGEGWRFCAEVRSLLPKLIFTHIVPCWSRSHEIVEK